MMQADATVARRFLLAGATLLPLGIAFSAIGDVSLGSVVSILGLTGLVAGLHMYGRAGPDPGA